VAQLKGWRPEKSSGHPENGKRFFNICEEVQPYGDHFYAYEGALYVNLTNRCDCACVFCLRHNGQKGSIYADDLWLTTSPPGRRPWPTCSPGLLPLPELVFCALGPMFRTDDICWLGCAETGRSRPAAVRINTNGHANLILAGTDPPI
jgi:hypothetical protein